MPRMDTRHWRRAGFIPAGDAARAVCLTTGGLHRQMDKGRIPYEMQGRFRFVKLTEMIRWVREHYTADRMQETCIARLKEARRLRSDYGQGASR